MKKLNYTMKKLLSFIWVRYFKRGSSGVQNLKNEKENLINLKPPVKESTCEFCKDNQICEYAFDPYNTDGDCLIDK